MSGAGGDRLVAARFLARPNRFIVRAELPGGGTHEVHLADPGRLKELLLPGAALRLRPAAAGKTRRTAFTLALVQTETTPAAWVSVETTRANRLAEGLLEKGDIRGIGSGFYLRREVRHGNSRFDFLLTRGTDRLWVEVKSVTLVHEGLGLFPDAPTTRGRRHVDELASLTRRGDSAMVLFVVQRGDASRVAPHPEIDPAFAASLSAAREAGVELAAVGFRFDARGRAAFRGHLPVIERPPRIGRT